MIFLAVWQRPEITRICFTGIKRLAQYDPKRFEVDALAVISEESMIPLCEEFGIKWVMHENKPLGRKKNFGLNACMRYQWDYLIEIGSDDILRNEILDLYEPLMIRKTPFFGMKHLAFYDTKNGDCNRINTVDVFGMGRCMERKMLESVAVCMECEINQAFIGQNIEYSKGEYDFIPVTHLEGWMKCGYVTPIGRESFHLWKNSINRGLDNNSAHFLMSRGVPLRHIPSDEPMGVDLKSDVNIWPFNRTDGTPYDSWEFFKHVSEEEREMILKLNQVAA